MEVQELNSKYSKLPPLLKHKVDEYVDHLLIQANTNEDLLKNGYGALKGRIWMSPDFDDPLEDFKDYM